MQRHPFQLYTPAGNRAKNPSNAVFRTLRKKHPQLSSPGAPPDPDHSAFSPISPKARKSCSKHPRHKHPVTFASGRGTACRARPSSPPSVPSWRDCTTATSTFGIGPCGNSLHQHSPAASQLIPAPHREHRVSMIVRIPTWHRLRSVLFSRIGLPSLNLHPTSQIGPRAPGLHAASSFDLWQTDCLHGTGLCGRGALRRYETPPAGNRT